MKRFDTIAICLVAGLAMSASLRAETAPAGGNPYEPVVARNIFGLNPPPPPPDPNARPVEPPVKITLNGIMSVFGQVKALYKVAGKTPGKDISYMFTEGQGEDDIDVVKIDEKGGAVTFNNHGMPQVVLLATASGSGAVTTGGSGAGIQGIPSAATATAGNSAFVTTFGGISSSATAGSSPASDAGSNLRPVPTRYGSQTQTPAIDPVVQTVMIEANRLKAQNEGDPIQKIYPPTELTPLLTPPSDSGDADSAPADPAPAAP